MAKRKKVKEVSHPTEINLWVFTNEKENAAGYAFLQMVYQGAYDNTIGYMEALNATTGKVDAILVGMDAEGNTYPLMKILSAEEAMNYLAPDGAGNYHNDRAPDPEPSPTAE